jgi:hypothetical protein
MARPKTEKAAQTIPEIEAQIAALKAQVEEKKQAQNVKYGELVRKYAEKDFANFDLEKFKAEVDRISKA